MTLEATSALDLQALSDEELEAAYLAELQALGITSEAQAQQELEEASAAELERWSRLGLEYPLADAVLWERDDAPWDQRRLVEALNSPLTLVLGGNRSGKTYAILQICAAMALGGDHPAVVAWLTCNHLPPDLVPDGPGEVIMAAPTAAQSIQIHRHRIDALLPDQGKQWWGRDSATAGARVEVSVPGYDRPARIWFKSFDQEHRSFKGTEVRFCALSEEPEGTEGELILEECKRACSSVNGRVVLEMTPQLGFTWVYDKIYKKPDKYRIVEIDTAHNVMVDSTEGLQAWLDDLTPEQREMRQKGRFVAMEGLVYKTWTRGNGKREGLGHLCDPFPIPSDWPRFRGIDFGLNNPTAVIWAALSPDDTLYIYRELHEASPTWEAHAQYIRDLERKTGEVIEAAWADSAEPGAIDIFCQHEVYVGKADKGAGSVNTGISKVADRLRLRPNKPPRLKVFHGCRDKGLVGGKDWTEAPVLVSEIEHYRWNPKMKEPTPIKKDDHSLDALRYLVTGISQWLGV